MAHIEIENLSFAYPAAANKKILDNINLSFEKGEYIVLCGKSGSGKTTLLRQLKSVIAPAGIKKGKILIDGVLTEELSVREQAEKIGYVMQNPDDQIVTDKVWHELAFGLESLGCRQDEMRARVAEMACYFGIQSWFHKNVSELSGGQKQLLNLASVMAMQPEILILDEPTAQLDPIAASDFLNTVRKINIELGTTVIITEHRLEDIFHAADRAVVMENGKIIANDTPRKTAALLYEMKNEMFAAAPAPVRIFSECGGEGECPLTVREGRQWLERLFENKNLNNKEKNAENSLCKQGVESLVADKNVIKQAGTKTNNDQDSTAEELFENSEIVLSVKEAWFRYEKELPDVLKGVDLQVPKSSLFAIVGGNGAGKSTFLKSICGICKPYRGKVKIFGKPADKYKNAELFENCLAMLPQDPKSLFVGKTLRLDLEEMTKDAEEIAKVAKLCQVEELLDSHPYDLSGGEQQRGALAKVLLTHPKILLLDEPTKGIDCFFKAKLSGIFEELKKQGMTIVMVSHDVEFCAENADIVGMFFDGQIISYGTPEDFFGHNSFYTTAAGRMSRSILKNAITAEKVIEQVKALAK